MQASHIFKHSRLRLGLPLTKPMMQNDGVDKHDVGNIVNALL